MDKNQKAKLEAWMSKNKHSKGSAFYELVETGWEACLAENKELHDSIWIDAPESAIVADVSYYDKPTAECVALKRGSCGHKEYTRNLPKTKERIIAERKAEEVTNRTCGWEFNEVAKAIEEAIIEARS
jgi:hypothetical protein